MGAVTDQPIPSTGAVTDLAIPETTTAAPDPDAASYQLTAGSLRKGLRSGFNQVGSMANAFAASVGDAVGLTEFAKQRMKDAEDQAVFADAVGPRVRDYRGVKDFTDLIDFVTGLVGQNAATMAPALAGGIGGRAVAGVRGAYAGAAAGGFVPNAGEQALRVKDTNATPGQKLGNVLATGVANTSLDMLAPGSVVAGVGKKAAKGSIAKEVAKTAGLEGVTEGAQEAIGQGMHTQLAPGRDKSGDTTDIIDNVIAGAVGGGALGGAGQITSKALGKIADIKDKQQSKDDVKASLNVKEKPLDEFNDEDILANPDLNEEQDILAAMEEKGAKSVEGLSKLWETVKNDERFKKFKDFATDDEVRAQFIDEAKKEYNDSEIAPKVKEGFESIKAFVKGAKGEIEKRTGNKPKESKQRTAVDFAVYDNMLKHLPEHVASNLTPTQKIELADYVKYIAMYEHGKRDVNEGPNPPAYDMEEKGLKREQDPTTRRRTLPSELLTYFGTNSTKLLNETNEILSKGGIAQPRDFSKDVSDEQSFQTRRTAHFENIVRAHLRDEVASDPEAREEAAKVLAPRLLSNVMRGMEAKTVKKDNTYTYEAKQIESARERQFQDEMDYAFGDNKGRVLAALDGLRKRMTVQQDDYFNEADPFTTEGDQPQETDGEQTESGVREETDQTDERAAETGVEEQGPYGDKRVGVPIRGLDRAVSIQKQLEGEYDPRRVSFTIEQTKDGRYTVEAKDRIADDTFSNTEWQDIREPEEHGKSGLKNGIMTVKLKDGRQNKINLVRLTSHAIRTTPRQDTGEVNYLYDMVSRGIAKLLADPKVAGLNEFTEKQVVQGPDAWDLPDSTPVAYLRGRLWTWKDVKGRINLDRDELSLRRFTSNMIEKAEQEAPTIQDIEEHILSRVTEQVAKLTKEHQDAFLQLSKMKSRGEKAGKLEGQVAKLGSELARMRRAEDRIEAEIDRRAREGDQPRHEIRGLVEDERIRNTTAAETPLGQRYVEADTGNPIHGPVPKGGVTGGQLETGIPDRDKQPGGVTTTKTKISDEQYLDEKDFNAEMKDQRKERNASTPSQAKKSLQETQKTGLIQRAKESDPFAWRKYLDRIEASNNEQALKDTLEFARAVETDDAKIAKRLDQIEAATEARLDAISYGKEVFKRKLDPSQVKDSENVWAVAESTDNLDHGAVLAVFKNQGDAQAYSEAVLGTMINEQMGKLRSKLGKSTTQNIGLDGEVSPEEQQRVLGELKRILGPTVSAKFVKGMKSAGSFIRDENGVETLSIHLQAMDAMGVGRHEAAHALFERLVKADPKMAQVLLAAASSPTIISRLRTLLKDHPQAIKQLEDPEERMAYMYQFWAAKQLTVGPNTRAAFAEVKSFFRKIAGIWSETFTHVQNMEKAEAVFELFDHGALADPSAVAQVLRDKFPKSPFDAATGVMPAIYKFLSKGFFTADGRIRDTNIPALIKIADQMFTPVGEQDKGPGMLQTRYMVMNRFQNKFHDILEKVNETDHPAILAALRQASSAPDRLLSTVKDIRLLLNEIYDYMEEKGVKVVEWNPKLNDGNGGYEEHAIKKVANYFPRYYDRQKIFENQDDFVKLLTTPQAGYDNPMSVEQAKEITSMILRNTKRDPKENDFAAGLTYFAPNAQHRTLPVPDSVLAPFLHQDLTGSIYSYLNYVTRRGEYASRFGNQGQEIEAAIAQAKAQGATVDDIRTFNQAVMAMEGSLGFDIKPEMKQIMGGIVTYQNYRLLSLALMTSLVDPIGIAVRGGGMKEAFNAFTYSIRGLFSENKGDAYHLAKLVGTISASSDAHMLADAYGTQFMTNWQRKANNFLFKWNGMEGWNRSMRVAATAAAQRFIIRHVTDPNEHSDRYLRELGLSADTVRISNGNLVLDEKIMQAISQWVDGAVLRPNAALRPVWMSDPMYMVVAHLKQFTYTFQKTIVARVVHEMENGNYTPAYALLSYVPLIIGADLLRVMLTPGGTDDEKMKKLGLGGLVTRGVQRAGLLGPGQYAVDAYGDLGHGKMPITSFGGPTAQQLWDFGAAAVGQGNFTQELKKAVPGYMLVR